MADYMTPAETILGAARDADLASSRALDACTVAERRDVLARRRELRIQQDEHFGRLAMLASVGELDDEQEEDLAAVREALVSVDAQIARAVRAFHRGRDASPLDD